MKKRIISLTLALFFLTVLLPPLRARAYETAAVKQENIVSTGNSAVGFVDKNGTLWMWGVNFFGQLGNGTTISSNVPIKVLDNVAAVSCGLWYTAAVRTDGTLWMWGLNDRNQLGYGGGNAYSASFAGLFHTPVQTVPVKVMDNVAAVSCGEKHTAAIRTDDTLWMWGDNFFDQLGNGTTKDPNVPIKVLDNVAAVSCGPYCTAAIKTDGTLWMWGSNLCGQLGNGTSESSSVPVKVLDNVSTVSCGPLDIAAVKTDGTLWTWGQIHLGVLGHDGAGSEKENYTIQKIPMLVAGLTAAAIETGASAANIAYARAQTVLLDGKSVTLQIYALKDSKGNESNYIKLRDLAYYLNGTKAQFAVDWQAGQIFLTCGQAYVSNGSELSTPFSGDRTYQIGTNRTVVDGSHPFGIISSIILTDDKGGAYTYYQLRDLGRELGFNVSYINGQVVINTNERYSDKQ